MMALDGWALASIITKLLLYLGALSAMGAVIFCAVFKSYEAARQPGLGRTVIAGSILAAAATLLGLPLKAGVLAGEGLAGMADPEMLELVWESSSGNAVLVRLAGLSLFLLATIVGGLVLTIAGLTGVILTGFSFGLVGHATGGPPFLFQMLLTLHLLGIAYWIGALRPLRRAAAITASTAEAAALAERFGQIAVFVVGGLIAAGVVFAWYLLGTPQALFTTAYGRLLGLKILLVTMLLGFAAFNKLRLVPAMRASDILVAHRLRRSIDAETVLVLAILTATAVLTTIMSLPEVEGGQE